MDFREREVDFQGADRRYAELTRQRDAGSISEEEFDIQRQRLMVRDDQGRWWAKLGESGEWHYRDSKTWVRGTPPGYGEELLPEPTNYFEEADRRYAELKGLYDAGEITEEEFDEQLKRSMVQDEGGRWWSKARQSGEWHYNDGRAWVRGTPPGYSPPTYDQNDQNGEVQRRREARTMVGLLVLFAILVVVFGGGAVVAAIFLDSTEGRKNTSPASENARIEGDLVGKTISEAAPIEGGDYKLKVSGVEQSDQPKGTIIEQTHLRSEPDLITIRLSGGQDSVKIPDVSGLSALQAGKLLVEAGLSPSVYLTYDQSGNPATATTIREDVDVTDQKISRTYEVAGTVVSAGELILLYTPTSEEPL